MGLIDNDFEHALQLVRKIRNDFAHQLEEESLSSQRQRPRVVELIRWIERSGLYETGLKIVNASDKSQEHVKFTACIVCMAVELKRGLRTMRRVYVGSPLTCINDAGSRILLTQTKFIEESLKIFLSADPNFKGMKFMLDVNTDSVSLAHLPENMQGRANSFSYRYSAPEDGNLASELARLQAAIHDDLIALVHTPEALANKT